MTSRDLDIAHQLIPLSRFLLTTTCRYFDEILHDGPGTFSILSLMTKSAAIDCIWPLAEGSHDLIRAIHDLWPVSTMPNYLDQTVGGKAGIKISLRLTKPNVIEDRSMIVVTKE